MLLGESHVVSESLRARLNMFQVLILNTNMAAEMHKCACFCEVCKH